MGNKQHFRRKLHLSKRHGKRMNVAPSGLDVPATLWNYIQEDSILNFGRTAIYID
jgi:hypothetical protein